MTAKRTGKLKIGLAPQPVALKIEKKAQKFKILQLFLEIYKKNSPNSEFYRPEVP
jgi:hypothetical protein